MTDPLIETKAQEVLETYKVAIFVVAYNAESHLESVLRRIPETILGGIQEIYVIDDCSTDQTYQVGLNIEWDHEKVPLNIYRIPKNIGYGGNQKLGYRYAIKKGHDIVVLLHGDGQYSPEALPNILAPYADGADAVFGSRFLEKGAARTGGMPKYKFYGNRILTYCQNKLLRSNLSEFHSGYRSYKTNALDAVPFFCNSNGFDFDADIIVQMVESGFDLKEVPIPTFYGDEICHVNGMLYAFQCMKTFTKNFLMKFEIFYDPKFDLKRRKHSYVRRTSWTTLNAYLKGEENRSASRVLDLGGECDEEVIDHLKSHGHQVMSINKPEDSPDTIALNLDAHWVHDKLEPNYDIILAIDVIEHLKQPELCTKEIYKHISKDGYFYASTGNVAFIIMRIMLLFGTFNYSKRGILDLTHTRLFTLNSFRRLMENAGFIVEEKRGFGIPFEDLRPNSFFFKIADRLSWALAKLWPSMFAFQFVLKCKRPVSLEELETEMFEKEKASE